MKLKNCVFETTGPGTAYLQFANHPGDLRKGRTVKLSDVLGKYDGPFIVFDFDEKNCLVGIEIIIDDDEEDEEETHLEQDDPEQGS